MQRIRQQIRKILRAVMLPTLPVKFHERVNKSGKSQCTHTELKEKRAHHIRPVGQSRIKTHIFWATLGYVGAHSQAEERHFQSHRVKTAWVTAVPLYQNNRMSSTCTRSKIGKGRGKVKMFPP